MNADTCQISEKNFECEEYKPSRWFMTNPSLVKHIKVYHTHEIEKFKCGYKRCQQLIGFKSALKQHKKWHFDIEEKKSKRDEKIAKEKERLEQEQKEKERQNLEGNQLEKSKPLNHLLQNWLFPLPQKQTLDLLLNQVILLDQRNQQSQCLNRDGE